MPTKSGSSPCAAWRLVAMLCATLFLPMPAPVLAQALDPVARSMGVDIPSRRRSFTPGEFALLPPYCPYQQFSPLRDTPEGRYWQATLGKALDDIHHYCRGLRDMHFARTVTLSPQHRRYLWERALGEVEYMIKHNPPTLVLMPEIYFRRGEILIELQQIADAQASFERSRQLKPDYWPAYTGWADFLMRNRRFDEARALIDEGLKHLPDSPELLQRRQQAGAAR